MFHIYLVYTGSVHHWPSLLSNNMLGTAHDYSGIQYFDIQYVLDIHMVDWKQYQVQEFDK